MMKPATMERRILSIDAAIRVLHSTLLEIEIALARVEAGLVALAPNQGLGGDMSPPPTPVSLRDHKDDAGGE